MTTGQKKPERFWIDMTEEMKKLRDKLAEENANKFYHAQGDITQVMPWSDCKESFINGFDACYKEMQAQVDEFKREEIARQKTFALGHTEIYICSLEEQLKVKDAQLDISVNALEYYGSISLGESGAWCFRKKFCFDLVQTEDMQFLLEPIGKNGEKYAIGGKLARQALTQIKELQGSTSGTKYGEESK